MRIAAISDIHANLPALESVLADIDRREPAAIWSLGDVVGYGAQPDGCARIVAERCDVSLAGNHDLAVLGSLDVDSFSHAAAAGVRWTRENASRETLRYLEGLPSAGEEHGIGLYHASPRDPVWEYVLWPDQAGACIEVAPQRISLIGHSHVALFFVLREPQQAAPGSHRRGRGSEARGSQAGDCTHLQMDRGRWLVNPGSVGQPRDGDPRAAWLELDLEACTATYRRVAYDVDRAMEAILEAGLPEHLGRRLHVGQ